MCLPACLAHDRGVPRFEGKPVGHSLAISCSESAATIFSAPSSGRTLGNPSSQHPFVAGTGNIEQAELDRTSQMVRAFSAQ